MPSPPTTLGFPMPLSAQQYLILPLGKWVERPLEGSTTRSKPISAPKASRWPTTSRIISLFNTTRRPRTRTTTFRRRVCRSAQRIHFQKADFSCFIRRGDGSLMAMLFSGAADWRVIKGCTGRQAQRGHGHGLWSPVSARAPDGSRRNWWIFHRRRCPDSGLEVSCESS